MSARERVKARIIDRVLATRALTESEFRQQFAALSPAELSRLMDAINSNVPETAGRAVLALRNAKLRELAAITAEEVIADGVISIDEIDKVL